MMLSTRKLFLDDSLKMSPFMILKFSLRIDLGDRRSQLMYFIEQFLK